jgi:hypothetical protein
VSNGRETVIRRLNELFPGHAGTADLYFVEHTYLNTPVAPLLDPDGIDAWNEALEHTPSSDPAPVQGSAPRAPAMRSRRPVPPWTSPHSSSTPPTHTQREHAWPHSSSNYATPTALSAPTCDAPHGSRSR